MNQEKFIEIIKEVVSNSSFDGIIGTMLHPPGRKPSNKLLEISEFYNELKDEDKQVVNNIIKLAIDSSVFGFLCVIDGVRSINESVEDNGSLKLSYINDASGKETVLNNPDEDYLYDIYNAE